MVEIIKTVLRIGFLTAAYTTVIGAMTGILPDLLLTFTDIEITGVIFGALASAVSILTWIFGAPMFRIGLWGWLVLPAIKLTIYFLHKIYYLGEVTSSAAIGATHEAFVSERSGKSGKSGTSSKN